MQHLKTELTQTIPLDLMQWAELPNDAFVRLPTVKRLYGVSCATIWRGVKNGTIPKPSKLSQRCTAWNVGLIRVSLAEKGI